MQQQLPTCSSSIEFIMFCFCCGILLSKKRYNLSSVTHSRQLSTWRRLFLCKVNDLGLKFDIDTMLREDDAGRVCYKCLNDLEKLQKLQESLNDRILNSVDSILQEERWSCQFQSCQPEIQCQFDNKIFDIIITLPTNVTSSHSAVLT